MRERYLTSSMIVLTLSFAPVSAMENKPVPDYQKPGYFAELQDRLGINPDRKKINDEDDLLVWNTLASGDDTIQREYNLESSPPSSPKKKEKKGFFDRFKNKKTEKLKSSKEKNQKDKLKKVGVFEYHREDLPQSYFDNSNDYGLNLDEISIALCLDRQHRGKSEGFPTDLVSYVMNRDLLGESLNVVTQDPITTGQQRSLERFKESLKRVLTQEQIDSIPQDAFNHLTRAKYDAVTGTCSIPE